jgi:hypothetical protein
MASLVIGSAIAGTAWGWGATGHRLLAEEAMRALPNYTPSFLRSPAGIADVGEYAREPDRWRGRAMCMTLSAPRRISLILTITV